MEIKCKNNDVVTIENFLRDNKINYTSLMRENVDFFPITININIDITITLILSLTFLLKAKLEKKGETNTIIVINNKQIQINLNDSKKELEDKIKKNVP